MKVNVMNDGVPPYEGYEWHINPATVCVAMRKRRGMENMEKDGEQTWARNTTST